MRRFLLAALGHGLGSAAILSTVAAYGQYVQYGQAPAAGDRVSVTFDPADAVIVAD